MNFDDVEVRLLFFLMKNNICATSAFLLNIEALSELVFLVSEMSLVKPKLLKSEE